MAAVATILAFSYESHFVIGHISFNKRVVKLVFFLSGSSSFAFILNKEKKSFYAATIFTWDKNWTLGNDKLNLAQLSSFYRRKLAKIDLRKNLHLGGETFVLAFAWASLFCLVICFIRLRFYIDTQIKIRAFNNFFRLPILHYRKNSLDVNLHPDRIYVSV